MKELSAEVLKLDKKQKKKSPLNISKKSEGSYSKLVLESRHQVIEKSLKSLKKLAKLDKSVSKRLNSSLKQGLMGKYSHRRVQSHLKATSKSSKPKSHKSQKSHKSKKSKKADNISLSSTRSCKSNGVVFKKVYTSNSNRSYLNISSRNRRNRSKTSESSQLKLKRKIQIINPR